LAIVSVTETVGTHVLASGTYFPRIIPSAGQKIPTHTSNTMNPLKMISWLYSETQYVTFKLSLRTDSKLHKTFNENNLANHRRILSETGDKEKEQFSPTSNSVV